jgi:hypothetical protein
MNKFIIAVFMLTAAVSTASAQFSLYDNDDNDTYVPDYSQGYNFGQMQLNQQLEQNWLDQQYRNSINPNCTGFNGC